MAMKVTFHPSFSSTYIHNEINGRIGIDFNIKKIRRVHCFTGTDGKKVCAFTVCHPLQNGETTYFMEKTSKFVLTLPLRWVLKSATHNPLQTASGAGATALAPFFCVCSSGPGLALERASSIIYAKCKYICTWHGCC
jgi:hypothetical protein